MMSGGSRSAKKLKKDGTQGPILSGNFMISTYGQTEINVSQLSLTLFFSHQSK